MRTILAFLVIFAAVDARADSQANNSDASRRAAEAAAAEQQRAQEDAQRIPQLGFDPTRFHTLALWPGKPVPCKLPKRAEPYTCYRLLEGPAIILSRMGTTEYIAARGDQALARGERSWWSKDAELPVPLVLGPGEALYRVGKVPDWWGRETDAIVTVYR